MRLLKKIALFILIVFVGIQLIPTNYNQSDAVLTTDFTTVFDVPKDIESLLRTSCYDCHSNTTNYPWYSKLQPFSWFLEKHIKEGKEDLNFNEFGSYSKRKQKSKLKSIISQIEDNEMPLASYTLFHRDAKLSETDKKHILDWLNAINDDL